MSNTEYPAFCTGRKQRERWDKDKEEELLSDCCGALPYGHVDEERMGLCIRCRDWATFLKEDEE